MPTHPTNGSAADAAKMAPLSNGKERLEKSRVSTAHVIPQQPAPGIDNATPATRAPLKDTKPVIPKQTPPLPAKKPDQELTPPPAKLTEKEPSQQTINPVQFQDFIGKIKQNNEGILSLCQKQISTLLRDVKEGVDQQQELTSKMEEEIKKERAKMDHQRREELNQLRARLDLQHEKEVRTVKEEMQCQMRKMEAEMKEREAKVQEQLRQVMIESDNNLRTVKEQLRKWEEKREEEKKMGENWRKNRRLF